MVKPCTDIIDTVRSVADARADVGLRVTEATPSCILQAAELYEQLRHVASSGNAKRLLDRYSTTNPGPNLEHLINGEPAEPRFIDPLLMESIDEVKSQALQFMQNYDAIVCPAEVVRAGTSRCGSLPVGVQVVAAPWREDIALAVAARIEALMGGYQKPEI